MSTFNRSVPSVLPAPRHERRGGAKGKQAREPGGLDNPHDGVPGFGGAPGQRRDYGGGKGGGAGPLLKGMGGKKL